MNDDSRFLNGQFERLKGFKNSAGLPDFNTDTPQEFKLKISPDLKVPRGKFMPDPLFPGGYIAHPITIRAMKKDIFVAGHDIDELAIPYTCHSCRADLDLQFWHFCPFCEASFITEK